MSTPPPQSPSSPPVPSPSSPPPHSPTLSSPTTPKSPVRTTSPPPTLLPPQTLQEPTPMDNLLAVAELELELQGGALPTAQYYRPEEEVARDVMSFDLGEPKAPDEIFFERKSHTMERNEVEDVFPSDLVSHKDLFESISEAHYLPELSGPHDEALLESLVEKGCEDNQILGQALDKLAHLVTASGEYEEDGMLLGDAPVTDIIDRLESLESPGRSSMSAAQGLLHLHHVGDRLPLQPQERRDPYILEEEFTPGPDVQCPLENLNSETEIEKTTDVNRLEYELNAEKRLLSDSETAAANVFCERVPDLMETYEDNVFEETSNCSDRSPKKTQVTSPTSLHVKDSDVPAGVEELERCEDELIESSDKIEGSEKQDSVEDLKPDVEELAKMNEDPNRPTDLSIMYIEDDQDTEPKDLTIRRLSGAHTSPRIDIPRAPSRESDAMQSPQPSGIPAMSSPEVFQAPPSKTKTQSILDAMFTSSSPKMYLTSEVSITKQQCIPSSLGKHRKSASPTVSSCSEEKTIRDEGEPLEKRSKRGAMDDYYQIMAEKEKEKKKKMNKPMAKKNDQETFSSNTSAIKQFLNLKANKYFNIPDPLLIPKDRLSAIQKAPEKEIPALLVERPELRYQDELNGERDPNILVVSIREFEARLKNKEEVHCSNNQHRVTPNSDRGSTTPTTLTQTEVSAQSSGKATSNQAKSVPLMGAEEIEAATSASLGMGSIGLWAQYAQQMEAMAACSQNADFLKALSASGYSGASYADLSQMLLNYPSQLMNPAGFPMMPYMEHDRMHMALCQEMMLQKMATQRRKSGSAETPREAAAKTSEFQSPYVHSTNKNYQGRPHSSARTSPIANSYTNQQRVAMAQHQFLQGMYPGMGGVRPTVPNLPMAGLNVPYYNPSAIGRERSPRTSHHKSPTPPSPSQSAYYANNNYLQSLKASETAAAAAAAHRAAHSPAEGARPRISVKKVDELRRRRDETEVGSTTPLGDSPHLSSDSSGTLWHPLFGNQKNYTSPWSWTTVTATGD